MPDEHALQILHEGDDDRVVLRWIVATGAVGAHLEVPVPDPKSRRARTEGIDGVISDAVSRARIGLGSVLVIDRNGRTEEETFELLLRRLSAQLAPNRVTRDARLITMTAERRVVRMAIACAGRPSNSLVNLGVAAHAMDDFILELMLDARVHEGLSELRGISHAVAIAKLEKVLSVLREQPCVDEVRTSKGILFLLRAITNFRASPSTYFQRTIESAATALGQAASLAAFSPLVADLADAVLRVRE